MIKSLTWVKSFAESTNRALLDGLLGWELQPDQADPLKWGLLLRSKQPIKAEEARVIRDLLRQWAEVNNASYRKSRWQGFDFTALIYVKGVGPVLNNNPFVEEEREHILRAR